MKNDENPGNFQELLELRLEGDNRTRTEHFQNTPRNLTDRSKTTQNEVINCCGEYIRNKIMAEVKEATFFLVLAVEATDVSNKEQILLVLRFMTRKEISTKILLCSFFAKTEC